MNVLENSGKKWGLIHRRYRRQSDRNTPWRKSALQGVVSAFWCPSRTRFVNSGKNGEETARAEKNRKNPHWNHSAVQSTLLGTENNGVTGTQKDHATVDRDRHREHWILFPAIPFFLCRDLRDFLCGHDRAP